MDSRQRVLRTLRFEPADRAPCDLMEGCIWPELLEYYRKNHGLETADQVLDFLDTDFRWTFLEYVGPPAPPVAETTALEQAASSKAVAYGPLAHASSLTEIEAYPWLDPAWFGPADYAAARHRWPDKALVFCPGWMPLFWTACELFGMQPAMTKILDEPEVFESLIQRQHAVVMNILERAAPAAGQHCDLAWLGDDFAHQQNMLVNPTLWRRFIKPYLAEQVSLLRRNGMLVLFHSCGAVRSVLHDLAEIGVNALLVFQTTARGMQAESIAREFGGKLAFYGGIDVQHLLSSGTPQEVEQTVRANLHAFTECGGYIVANSHHSLASIRGENITAMCNAVKTFNTNKSV
jgi:uroporphyrinogen decarboxylase